MTDKILCPWCGRNMEIYCEEQELEDYIAWSSCTYGKCAAEGPFIRGAKTEEEAIRLATEAAIRRYEPPCGPMTIEEIKERRERKDANPMWIEWRLSPEKSGWILSKTMNALTIEYNNFLWRCWPRKPTEQEREAYGWGE